MGDGPSRMSLWVHSRTAHPKNKSIHHAKKYTPGPDPNVLASRFWETCSNKLERH